MRTFAGLGIREPSAGILATEDRRTCIDPECAINLWVSGFAVDFAMVGLPSIQTILLTVFTELRRLTTDPLLVSSWSCFTEFRLFRWVAAGVTIFGVGVLRLELAERRSKTSILESPAGCRDREFVPWFAEMSDTDSAFCFTLRVIFWAGWEFVGLLARLVAEGPLRDAVDCENFPRFDRGALRPTEVRLWVDIAFSRLILLELDEMCIFLFGELGQVL